MQRGRGGRDDFFGGFGGGGPFGGSPFAGLGGFGPPGGLFPSLFDDPFFNRPFESMLGPSMFGESFFPGRPNAGFLHHANNRIGIGMGPGMFGESFFHGPPNTVPMHHLPEPANNQRGPIITELNSDGEEEQEEEEVPKAEAKDVKDNPRKHLRSSKEPLVQDPDEETEERKGKQTQYRADYNRGNAVQPQAQMYSFHCSSVTYGGSNGAYYTSSKTRRTGGDGVTIEESKEADTTTGKATHRVSRGMGYKGHSVTRNLNSDGRVNTMQTLHNLNEDDLPGFERAWDGSARQNLPGWNRGIDMLDGRGSGQNGQASVNRRALPSSQQPPHTRMGPHYQPNTFDRASK